MRKRWTPCSSESSGRNSSGTSKPTVAIRLRIHPPSRRLGGRPITAMKDGDPTNVGQASEHVRHVEELRGDVAPRHQPSPVEVTDGRPRLLPAGYLEQPFQVGIVEALIGIHDETIGELA